MLPLHPWPPRLVLGLPHFPSSRLPGVHSINFPLLTFSWTLSKLLFILSIELEFKTYSLLLKVLLSFTNLLDRLVSSHFLGMLPIPFSVF